MSAGGFRFQDRDRALSRLDPGCLRGRAYAGYRIHGGRPKPPASLRLCASFVFGFPIATAVVSAGSHARQAWLGASAIMAVRR